MNISLVKYTQEFKHNGVSTWIGAEMTLEPGDDAMVAKKELKSFIHAAYYGDTIIPVEDALPPEPIVLPSIQVKNMPIEEQIKNSRNLKELEWFKFIASMNPKLQEVYNNTFTILNILDKPKFQQQ